MKNGKLRTIVITAMMAALIAVVTLVVRIPVLTTGAYINAGDSFVYLAGYILGGGYAACAAGIGSMLADIIAGAGVYIIPTLIIKAAMGFVCSLMMTKGAGNVRFLLSCIVGGVIMVVGYGVFELFMFGAAVAITTLYGNLIQLVGGVVIAFVLYLGVSRMNKKLFPKYDR